MRSNSRKLLARRECWKLGWKSLSSEPRFRDRKVDWRGGTCLDHEMWDERERSSENELCCVYWCFLIKISEEEHMAQKRGELRAESWTLRDERRETREKRCPKKSPQLMMLEAKNKNLAILYSKAADRVP